jgi:hypothetical protein
LAPTHKVGAYDSFKKLASDSWQKTKSHIYHFSVSSHGLQEQAKFGYNTIKKEQLCKVIKIFFFQFKNFSPTSQPNHYQHPQQHDSAGTASISRSVSFMGGRQPRSQPPPETSPNFGASSTSWRPAFDTGGRRSVESTPQTARRQQQQQQPIYSSPPLTKSPPEKGGTRTRALPSASAADGPTGPAIEGYCTPMINRKTASSVDRSDSGISRDRFYKTSFRPKTFRINFIFEFWTSFRPKTTDTNSSTDMNSS